MRNLIGRRDLLKYGAVTTVGSVLTPRGSPPPAEAGERTGVPSGAHTTGLSSDRTLEALKEAVRWPTPAVPVILALTGRYLAAGRDEEAYGYFREPAAAAPDQAIFMALEGMFQARMAGQVFLLRRVAWVKEAIAKLDRAADTGHPVARYLRGVALAELPARFGRAESAVAELEWVLQHREGFPPGLRRGVYRSLARAFTTLGRRAEAKAALERSGYPSLDPALPQFTTDFSVTARDGFRFRPPRLLEVAPRVHVAQGYDFADIAFVLTDGGIVAVDAGTTEATAQAALSAVRRRSSHPITHVIVTHAHWDHIGGLAALTASGTRVIAQAPLTELFTVEALAGFEPALREVHARTLEGIGDGRTLAEMLQQNWLPSSLRAHPQAVMAFLVVRDNFIQRVAHQRTGYWKADGDGIDVLSPREWAGVLNLLAGGQEAAFVRSVRTLLEQGDEALALKLAELGLLSYPASRALTDLRRHALDRLRVRYQALDPFKFIVYSEWAKAELSPVE